MEERKKKEESTQMRPSTLLPSKEPLVLLISRQSPNNSFSIASISRQGLPHDIQGTDITAIHMVPELNTHSSRRHIIKILT